MQLTWQQGVMLLVSFFLLYLAIHKKYEPLLLLPIAFGMLLTNLPGAEMFHSDLWSAFLDENSPVVPIRTDEQVDILVKRTIRANEWSTICLPFTVSSITCGEKDLEWFHSESDTGKHFWLMKFSNDGPNEVNFGYTNSLEANTPYIMTVPDDRWGEEWNLAGKDITFTGNHVTIKSNPKAVVSGSNFKFHGLAKGQNIENVFVMNNDGDYFERKSSAQHVDPFRAYFDVVTYTNFTSSLSIGFNTFEATAIFNIKRASIEDNEAVYNLQGVKVGTTDQKDCLPKGVYIINKKKVIIK